jgi:hypothetical protein
MVRDTGFGHDSRLVVTWLGRDPGSWPRVLAQLIVPFESFPHCFAMLAL